MSSKRQKLLTRVNMYLQWPLKHITEEITGTKFYYRGGRYRQVSLYCLNQTAWSGNAYRWLSVTLQLLRTWQSFRDTADLHYKPSITRTRTRTMFCRSHNHAYDNCWRNVNSKEPQCWWVLIPPIEKGEVATNLYTVRLRCIAMIWPTWLWFDQP